MANIKKIAIPVSIFAVLALTVVNTSDAVMSTNNIVVKPKVNKNSTTKTTNTGKSNIKKYKWIEKTATSKDLRKFPYPYKSMLAISSDIDDTTLDEFETYHYYLNTKCDSSFGIGLGLDIGDSFWIFMGSKYKVATDVIGGTIKDVMTFCDGLDTTKLHDADKILKYIKCGWIDSLHAFGDFSTTSNSTLCTREYAIKAWDIMKKYNIRPTIWINHGTPTNHQNFGAYKAAPFFHYQKGDFPNSEFYHTDITIKNGIHYIWDSRASSVFGVDYPMYEMKLADGQKIWSFHRYANRLVSKKDSKGLNIKKSIEWIWDTPTFYQEITTAHLNEIIKKHQYSIVAQHLGLGNKDVFPFNDLTIRQLKLLASYQDQKKILVARTSRLLNYALSQRYVSYKLSSLGNSEYINITKIKDPIFGSKVPTLDDLRGITFYSSFGRNTHILINNEELPQSELQFNPADETGKKSVSIKWFKRDVTDYTQY